MARFLGCILLKFYIKPQPLEQMQKQSEVVSYWNSTSNHNPSASGPSGGAVVSYWNSTSNHNGETHPSVCESVVSYWNSTSNHNSGSSASLLVVVVSYWNSTSNHNVGNGYPVASLLYLIEILHQTTTIEVATTSDNWLYLIEILHQTTTNEDSPLFCYSCILLKFYIKPQPNRRPYNSSFVVSYWNSTSNHNLRQPHKAEVSVVSYWNSTSNHNVGPHIDW